MLENLQEPAEIPDCNLSQHLWDELEHWLWARLYRPASVANLTNGLCGSMGANSRSEDSQL